MGRLRQEDHIVTLSYIVNSNTACVLFFFLKKKKGPKKSGLATDSTYAISGARVPAGQLLRRDNEICRNRFSVTCGSTMLKSQHPFGTLMVKGPSYIWWLEDPTEVTADINHWSASWEHGPVRDLGLDRPQLPNRELRARSTLHREVYAR